MSEQGNSRTSHWCFVLIAFLVALSALPAMAQTPHPQPPGPPPDPARPSLNPFPAEQNWSFLADPSKRTDLFDPIKYVPFGDNPQLYLSLGFEYRIQYEYYDNWRFGAGPQDHNGYVMNRVMPHFDFHAGSEQAAAVFEATNHAPGPAMPLAPGDRQGAWFFQCKQTHPCHLGAEPCSRRPATTTRAPSLANAVARPIPVNAPVIKTTGELMALPPLTSIPAS